MIDMEQKSLDETYAILLKHFSDGKQYSSWSDLEMVIKRDDQELDDTDSIRLGDETPEDEEGTEMVLHHLGWKLGEYLSTQPTTDDVNIWQTRLDAGYHAALRCEQEVTRRRAEDKNIFKNLAKEADHPMDKFTARIADIILDTQELSITIKGYQHVLEGYILRTNQEGLIEDLRETQQICKTHQVQDIPRIMEQVIRYEQRLGGLMRANVNDSTAVELLMRHAWRWTHKGLLPVSSFRDAYDSKSKEYDALSEIHLLLSAHKSLIEGFLVKYEIDQVIKLPTEQLKRAENVMTVLSKNPLMMEDDGIKMDLRHAEEAKTGYIGHTYENSWFDALGKAVLLSEGLAEPFKLSPQEDHSDSDLPMD